MNKYMKYSKILSIVGILLILMGVTYSFFNYTRTGSANTISVGRVSFSSSQSNTINLTNAFPIKRTNAPLDNTNSSEVIITITGDTTYSDGVEYLVSVDGASIEANVNKKLPIGVIVTPEKTGELGTSDEDYYDNRGGNSSIYKVLANETVVEDDYLLVGYIKAGTAEINGTIGIRVFIDLDNMVISDTYDGTESDENGTTRNWVNGRTVITTEEWNNLTVSGLSFKIRVEANEGIWVPEPTTRNDMANIGLGNTITLSQKAQITEIEFIRMSEEMINTHPNSYDLTEENGEGMVKAWIDGTKLYIASPGETYFPIESDYLFKDFPIVESIKFNNINTSEVERMFNMFYHLSTLRSIDVSSFDTSNVTTMQGMFRGCSSLTSINIDNFDLTNLEQSVNMFAGCTGITSLDLSKVTFGSTTHLSNFLGDGGINYINLSGNKIYNNLGGMLCGSNNVETIDMIGLDASEASNLGGFFQCSPKLKTINARGMKLGASVSSFISSTNSSLEKLESVDFSNVDGSLVTAIGGMFSGVSSLKTINLEGANFNSATSLGGMFSSLSGLTSVNLKNTNFSGAISTSGMFSGVGNSVSINLSNANFSGVATTSGMFSGNISSIDLKNINFSSLTNASYMFSGLSSLSNLNLTGVRMDNVQNMSNMFSGCSGLTSLDLSHLNTSNVTNMSGIVNGATNLVSINLSGLGSNSLQSISNPFGNCTNLKNINMSNFNFGTITDLSEDKSPFYNTYDTGITNIETINLNGANMHNVTTLKSFFSDISSGGYYSQIKEIDMSNMDLSSIQNMFQLFAGCKRLENVKFKNTSVTIVTNMEGMFQKCSNIEMIDLSSFDTSNVTNMRLLFYDCSSLKTIYVSNMWNTGNITDIDYSSAMFYSCLNLVGGQGTVFDSNHIRHDYAHVDGGPSNPGYLTLKTN